MPHLLPPLTLAPGQTPQQWLDDNFSQIITGLNASGLDEKAINECNLIVSQIAIYQRFVVYIYTHLKLNRHWLGDELLRELVQILKPWMTWDVMSCLVHYQTMGDQLWAFLRKAQKLSVHPSKCDSRDHIADFLDLDVAAICAHLADAITDRTKFREFFGRSGEEAQSLLNLLQVLLDFPHLTISLRSQFVNALVLLSRGSGLYPECLVLRGVQWAGDDPIAAGRFGDVYKGRIRGQQVAIKKLRVYEKTNISKHLKQFSREAIIWRNLWHPNVLPFHGIYHLNEKKLSVCLVSPWMEHGNIRQFLEEVPNADRVRLILDVARGLEYLHSIKIIHGDLKGVNILITPSLRACLADFGLSTAADSQVLRLTSVSTALTGGTLRWEAPELLDGSLEAINPATDMYSYACVCYEVFTDNIPFYDHLPVNDFAIALKVTQGKRPTRPASNAQTTRRGLNDEIWNLIESCWRADPSERPTARSVVAQLQTRPSLGMLTDPRRPFGSDWDWDECFVPELRSSLADHPFAHSQFRSPSPSPPFLVTARPASDVPIALPDVPPTQKHNPSGLHSSSVVRADSGHSHSSGNNSNEGGLYEGGLWTPLLKMYYDDSAALIANYPVGRDNLAIYDREEVYNYKYEPQASPITPHRPIATRLPLATISRQGSSKKKSPHKRSATYSGTSNVHPEPSSRKTGTGIGTALRSYRLVDDWLHTVGISTGSVMKGSGSGAIGLKRSFAIRNRNRSATFNGVPTRDQPLTPDQADDWAYIYAGHSAEDLR